MISYFPSGYDFGYTWPWTFGHLLLAVIFAAAGWWGRKRLPRWGSAALFIAAGWALAGFLIVQFVFYFNSPPPMPTARFMAEGRGKALDIGCGSGRTTIMLGQARPELQITALDNFSAEYIRNNGEELLRQNLRKAGIDPRVRVMQADMRQIPAADGEFDGVVSSYAIDHLNRKGIEQTLGEVSRVLKPGGEFLLMIIRSDGWLTAVYGPLAMHHVWGAPDFWHRALTNAHLAIVEEGTSPGSAYYLCRKE